MAIVLPINVATGPAVKSVKQLESQVRHTARVAQTEANKINSIFMKMEAGFGSFGIASFLKQIVEVRGEFQKLEVAFNVLLQNKEKANNLMAQMVETAATTPFSLQDVASGAKQLLAYGVAAENVNDTLIRLGDISAALSIPLGDLVYLYGTTMTQGRLYTRDYVQFLGRGIPLQKELAAVIGTTEDKVSQFVKDGKVGFAEINAAIVNMTNNGGTFGGMMKEMSKTFTGQISNIKDQISVIFNDLGKNLEEPINFSLDFIRKLLDNYELLLASIGSVIALKGTEKAAVMATGAATLAAQEKQLAMYKEITAENIYSAATAERAKRAEVDKRVLIEQELDAERKRLAAIYETAAAEKAAALQKTMSTEAQIASIDKQIARQLALADAYTEKAADLVNANRYEEAFVQVEKSETAQRKANELQTRKEALAVRQVKEEKALELAIERERTVAFNINSASLTKYQSKMLGLTRTLKEAGKQFASFTGLTALANPVVDVALALGTLVYAVHDYREAVTRLERAETALKEEFDKNNKTYTENVVLYERLKTSWNSLVDDIEARQKFLEEHQMEMSRLGAATNDVAEAESYFKDQTGAIIESYRLRAQAAAAAALATKYYQDAMENSAQADNAENTPWYKKVGFLAGQGLGNIGAAIGDRWEGLLRFNSGLFKFNGADVAKGWTQFWGGMEEYRKYQASQGFTEGQDMFNTSVEDMMKARAKKMEEDNTKLAERFQNEFDDLTRQADELFKPKNSPFTPKKGSGEDDDKGKGRTPEQIANEQAKAKDAYLEAVRARAKEQTEAIVEMESNLAEAHVEAMRDGFAKTQAEERRQHAQSLVEIEEERKERIRKELEELKKEFDAREDMKVVQSKNKKGKATYARQTFDMDRALQEVMAGNFSPESYIASISPASVDFIKKINDFANNFTAYENDRFNYVMMKMLQEHLGAEQEKLDAIKEQYGSYLQQLEAYASKRDIAINAQGATANDIAVAQAEYERQVQALQFDRAKAYGDIMMAFDDVNNLTTNVIDELILKMETYRNTTLQSLGTDQILEFNEQLTRLYDIKTERQREGVRYTQADVKEMERLLQLRIDESKRVLQTLQAKRETLRIEEDEAQIALQNQLSKLGMGTDISGLSTLYDQTVAMNPGASPFELDKLNNYIGNLVSIRTTLGGVNGEIDVTKGQLANLSKAAEGVTKGGMSNFLSFIQGGIGATSGGSGATATLAIVDKIVHAVNDGIHSAADALADIKETMDSLGADTDARTGIGKAAAGLEMFAAASGQATKAWESLKSGDAIGVIAGVIGSFTEWIKGFARLHDAKLNEDIDDISDSIHDLKNAYDDIGDAVERAYGKGAATLIEQQNKYIEQQIRLVEEQMALENQKKNTDEDAITGYEDTLRELRKQYQDNKEAAIDAIFGEDIKAAINRFADAYMDAIGNGKNFRKTSKEAIIAMIQSMITESMKADISKPMELLRQKMNAYWVDNIISPEEQADIEMAAESLAEQLRQKYSWADSIIKGEGQTYTASSGAFEGMSQESADELNGRFAMLQVLSQEELLVTRGIDGRLENIETYTWNIQKDVATIVSALTNQQDSIRKIAARM